MYATTTAHFDGDEENSKKIWRKVYYDFYECPQGLSGGIQRMQIDFGA